MLLEMDSQINYHYHLTNTVLPHRLEVSLSSAINTHIYLGLFLGSLFCSFELFIYYFCEF